MGIIQGAAIWGGEDGLYKKFRDEVKFHWPIMWYAWAWGLRQRSKVYHDKVIAWCEIARPYVASGLPTKLTPTNSNNDDDDELQRKVGG